MFELINKYLAETSNDYDTMIMRVDSFTEAVDRTLAINYHEAELKVLQENGTDDALMFYYEAAISSMAENIRRSIDKIIEAIQKFFSDTQEKIIVMVTDIKNKEALSSIEKKVKLLPLLGKKKVLVENYNEEAKIADEATSRLIKLKAKLRSGQEVGSEHISDVEKWYHDEHNKVIGVAKAVPITISSAISVLKEMSSDAGSMLKKSQKEVLDHMKDLKDLASKDTDPRTTQALARAFSNVAKSKVTDFVRCMGNIASTVRGSIKSFTTKGAETKESTDAMGTDSSATDKAMDDAVKEIEKNSGVAKEEGNDEGISDDPIDSVANDPWASILNDLGIDDSTPDPEVYDGECGVNCNTAESSLEENGPEEPTSENATDTFETLYKKIVGDSAPAPSDDAALSGKPNNDKLVSDIFKDVEAEVKDQNPEPKPVEPIKESAFDMLMAEIENL